MLLNNVDHLNQLNLHLYLFHVEMIIHHHYLLLLMDLLLKYMLMQNVYVNLQLMVDDQQMELMDDNQLNVNHLQMNDDEDDDQSIKIDRLLL